VTFFLFLLYLIVSYLNPAEIFPVLGPYHVAFWIGIIALVFATGRCIARSGAPLLSAQIWMLAGFTLIMSVSRVIADNWLGAPVAVVDRFGPSLTMFVLAVFAVDSIRKLRAAGICIVLLSMSLLAQGAAAYHFGYHASMFLFDPNVRTEYVASDDNDDVDSNDDEDNPEARQITRIRGLGFLNDPNDLALSFVIAIPLLGLMWMPGAAMRNLLFVILPTAGLIYGVYLTQSRGGTVAVVVTLLPVLWYRFGKVRALVLILAMIAVVGTLSFGGRTFSASEESAAGRVTAWKEGFEMLKSQPLVGVGYTLFLEHHTLTAHNSFVLCFAETGLIGYFFWLGMILITLFQLHALTRIPQEKDADSEIRRWAIILRLSLIAFIAAAFFLSRTFIPLLYMLIGLGTALVLVARQEDRVVRLPSLPRLGSLLLACEFATILFIYIIVKVTSVLPS
jgi:putative inorganic carbon (HCO3(-)) transporter